MLGGNVEDFRAVWCLKSLAADQTLLTLEVFMLPRLPMLTSILNKENTRGAVKGVVAMRDRIEGQKKK
jgi:hypothetical protein